MNNAYELIKYRIATNITRDKSLRDIFRANDIICYKDLGDPDYLGYNKITKEKIKTEEYFKMRRNNRIAIIYWMDNLEAPLAKICELLDEQKDKTRDPNDIIDIYLSSLNISHRSKDNIREYCFKDNASRLNISNEEMKSYYESRPVTIEEDSNFIIHFNSVTI